MDVCTNLSFLGGLCRASASFRGHPRSACCVVEKGKRAIDCLRKGNNANMSRNRQRTTHQNTHPPAQRPISSPLDAGRDRGPGRPSHRPAKTPDAPRKKTVCGPPCAALTFPPTYFPTNFPPSGQVSIPSPWGCPLTNHPSNCAPFGLSMKPGPCRTPRRYSPRNLGVSRGGSVSKDKSMGMVNICRFVT